MKRGTITAVTRRQMDRVAEHMAEGCHSIVEVAYRMRLPQSSADRLWQLIRRELGPQAR